MHEYKIVAFITPGWAITCCNFVIFTEVKSAIMSEFNVHAFSGMYNEFLSLIKACLENQMSNIVWLRY